MAQLNESSELQSDSFFENLKGWLRPRDVAKMMGISVKTVYDWNHRPHRRRAMPEGLFVKFNGQLFVRTDVLRVWISQQNTG